MAGASFQPHNIRETLAHLVCGPHTGVKQVANDEANSVLNVDLAGERKMLEARKEGEASKVSYVVLHQAGCIHVCL